MYSYDVACMYLYSFTYTVTFYTFANFHRMVVFTLLLLISLKCIRENKRREIIIIIVIVRVAAARSSSHIVFMESSLITLFSFSSSTLLYVYQVVPSHTQSTHLHLSFMY